jgi:hypothetical protein
MKYNEGKTIKEVEEYIKNTYDQHYSEGVIQTLDFIEACGDVLPFCRSNIIKYASRYDKKGSPRKDIFKIIHYAMLLLYFSEKEN